MEYINDRGAFYQYIYSHCGCINAGQTQEERRLKYAIARSFGKCRQDAQSLRDYRITTFTKYFGYSSWNSLIKFIKGES